MPYSSEQSIIIRENDGRLKNFDAGEFETRIRDGFSSSGTPDAYLAEDIAFALEFALVHAADNAGTRIFARKEVEETLGRILEDSGLEAVRAEMTDEVADETFVPGLEINGAMVTELVRVHFGISAAEARLIAGMVREAMQKINITVSPPELIIAMAGYYKNRRERAAVAESKLASRRYRRFRGKAVEFFLQDDAIVPCRKLRISLPGIAADEKWDLPLTELTSAALLKDFGSRLNDIAGMERRELPLAVIVSETSSGAAEVLGAPWPESRKILKELLEYMWAGLGETPARIMFKSEG